MKEQVPEDQWAYTPIWLKATAGMRLIDKAQSDAVLLSVRGFLGDSAKSPFMFRQSWARIISGNEEGGFGWIAFNYLKKVIGPKKVEGVLPYAVVEMGGASSQVSQIAPSKKEAEAIPAAYRFSFTIEGDEFDLYTHSYLGFGAEQAREALNKQLLTAAVTAAKTVDDPCLNTGKDNFIYRFTVTVRCRKSWSC
jgi:Golgi nucleoside diphosphatase